MMVKYVDGAQAGPKTGLLSDFETFEELKVPMIPKYNILLIILRLYQCCRFSASRIHTFTFPFLWNGTLCRKRNRSKCRGG